MIKIFYFLPLLDDKNLWLALLYGLFSLIAVGILGFIVGYLIPKFYSDCLRDLNERTENMDERGATYRLNTALTEVRNHSNTTGPSS